MAERVARDRAQKHNYQADLKNRAIENLEGKCKGCSCADPELLQFDNIHGRGTRHNKSVSWSKRYRNIIEGAPGWQLLCAQCNWKKRQVDHDCPEPDRVMEAGIVDHVWEHRGNSLPIRQGLRQSRRTSLES